MLRLFFPSFMDFFVLLKLSTKNSSVLFICGWMQKKKKSLRSKRKCYASDLTLQQWLTAKTHNSLKKEVKKWDWAAVLLASFTVKKNIPFSSNWTTNHTRTFWLMLWLKLPFWVHVKKKQSPNNKNLPPWRWKITCKKTLDLNYQPCAFLRATVDPELVLQPIRRAVAAPHSSMLKKSL